MLDSTTAVLSGSEVSMFTSVGGIVGLMHIFMVKPKN
jgi:hypothetical protein